MDLQDFKGDMDQCSEAVDERFEAIERRFEEMLALIFSESEKTRLAVLEDGERTRRHFDVVVNQRSPSEALALGKAIAADERAGRLTATHVADHVECSAQARRSRCPVG